MRGFHFQFGRWPFRVTHETVKLFFGQCVLISICILPFENPDSKLQHVLQVLTFTGFKIMNVAIIFQRIQLFSKSREKYHFPLFFLAKQIHPRNFLLPLFAQVKKKLFFGVTPRRFFSLSPWAFVRFPQILEYKFGRQFDFRPVEYQLPSFLSLQLRLQKSLVWELKEIVKYP